MDAYQSISDFSLKANEEKSDFFILISKLLILSNGRKNET